MDDDACHAAYQSAVDADELKVAANRIFHAIRNGGCIPAGNGFGHQLDDIVAVILGRANNGAAGKAVDLMLEPCVFLQSPTKLNQRIAKASRQRRVGVAGRL